MRKWLAFTLLGVSSAAWATEPTADYTIAKKMLQQSYQQTWLGEELGDTYYLDSKVAIDAHHFYIRADGMGKTVSLVSCAPKARYISTIAVQTGNEIEEYPNNAAHFTGKDLQDFVQSFVQNADLKVLCAKK